LSPAGVLVPSRNYTFRERFVWRERFEAAGFFLDGVRDAVFSEDDELLAARGAACAAISRPAATASALPSPIPGSFGSFCFRVRRGANRSPIFSTRART